MKPEIPGCDEESGDEPSFREAKAEPARFMELELPYRFRMRAGITGFAGFVGYQNSERGAV